MLQSKVEMPICKTCEGSSFYDENGKYYCDICGSESLVRRPLLILLLGDFLYYLSKLSLLQVYLFRDLEVNVINRKVYFTIYTKVYIIYFNVNYFYL